MNKKKFSIKQRIKSFRHAFRGLYYLFRNEHNAWIHCFMALCVIVAGFVFQLSTTEWIFVLFAIGLVFMAELLNSALEQLCNAVTIEHHPLIKKSKDLGAAAVLIAAITAAIVGFLVFLSKLIALF
jgi:diacylglycerol kinase (ATP)